MRRRTSVTALSALLLAPLLAVTASALPASAQAFGTVKVQLVTPSGHALALANTEVQFEEYISGKWVVFGNDETDANGAVTYPINPGKVRVIPLVPEPYARVATSSFTVSAGKTVSKKANVPVAATISGHLTAAGSPLTSAYVTVLTTGGSFVNETSTDASGNYTVPQLATGSYIVQFNPQYSTANPANINYAWGYYKSSTSTTTKFTSATKVSVKQQGASSSASKKTGVNGHVDAYQTMTLSAAFTNGAGANANVQFVSAHKADFVRLQTYSNKAVTARLIPGKYRVSIDASYDQILGKYITYWYSASHNVTTDESKATWITFSGKSPMTITFRNYVETQPN